MKNKNKQTKFPVARIKRIMQKDEEVGKVAQATPVVISKALEMFLQTIVQEAAKVTAERGAKKVEAYHLKHAVETVETLDFLKEIVEGVPDPSAGGTIDLAAEAAEKAAAKKRARPRRAPAAATAPPGDDDDEAPAPPKRRRRKAEPKADGAAPAAPRRRGKAASAPKQEEPEEEYDAPEPEEGVRASDDMDQDYDEPEEEEEDVPSRARAGDDEWDG
ncbi:histone-fold-containing protein [Phanerochaete sordida]|uniref:Histone-fold-containing protein n=1 Tax=Phanerochaete sordida TaxID=48140 RepID=A0A9P3LGG7_9APHY|nr:histone-fold-containing protein [Phanerochaete sordida]